MDQLLKFARDSEPLLNKEGKEKRRLESSFQMQGLRRLLDEQNCSKAENGYK